MSSFIFMCQRRGRKIYALAFWFGLLVLPPVSMQRAPKSAEDWFFLPSLVHDPVHVLGGLGILRNPDPPDPFSLACTLVQSTLIHSGFCQVDLDVVWTIVRSNKGPDLGFYSLRASPKTLKVRFGNLPPSQK